MKLEPIAACQEILTRRGATEIYVFGSHARGNAHANSDLDLAVSGLNPAEYFTILGELTSAIKCSVDLIQLDDGSAFASHLREKIARGWLTGVG